MPKRNEKNVIVDKNSDMEKSRPLLLRRKERQNTNGIQYSQCRRMINQNYLSLK